MVGRKVILQVEKEDAHPAGPVLTIDDMQVRDDRKHLAVKGLSLEVRAGEILGVAGVQGNGQREFVEALTGLRTMEGGRVTIAGEDATGMLPRAITELDVAHIPEDREKHGLVGAYSIAENMVLNRYYRTPFSRRAVMDRKAIAENGARL